MHCANDAIASGLSRTDSSWHVLAIASTTPSFTSVIVHTGS